MISLAGQKMSKSKGNLVFVSRLRADGIDPAAIRLALLAGHYRADRPWTDDVLQAAEERLRSWRKAAKRSGSDASAVLTALRAALADDLDTPAALVALDDWSRDESLDGGLVADASEALLGITLR
jgi:L-cysteine:1D-myo-inositol 2-amino-2-deoxy-alpha-D-glucopyranoside ligase